MTWLITDRVLLGISETSSNMQDLLEIENTDGRAAEAVALFCYQVKKSIGAFTAALKADSMFWCFQAALVKILLSFVLVFVRDFFIQALSLMKNKIKRTHFKFQWKPKAVKVYVIPTNEELMIAKTAAQIFQKLKLTIQ